MFVFELVIFGFEVESVVFVIMLVGVLLVVKVICYIYVFVDFVGFMVFF